MKSKAGRPRGKRYDASLNIPIEKTFYNKFRLAAQCEGLSACQLGRRILYAWMLQQGKDILKNDMLNPAMAASSASKTPDPLGEKS